MHQAWFLDGDAHHVLKEVDQEVEAYDKALGLRKEILARPLKHANTAVDGMCATLTKTSALDELDELLMGNTRLEGAIHTAEAVDKASSLLRILNDNATLVFSWREKIIELLKRPLDAEDNAPGLGEGQEVEDPDKEYYAEALKSQGEGE
jgi:E3 ubiquitin-protein ligase SHPRH